MMAQTAAQLAERLQTLKGQRRDGTLDLRGYYRELLTLTGMLVESLTEEIDSMEDQEIALQIPLVLVFLEEQISKFGDRS